LAIDKEFLRSVALFRELGPRELETASLAFHERRFAKGQVIFTDEDTGQYMYVVKSGRVKVSRWLPSGREVILAFHDVGDYFGEMALLDGRTEPATITAVTPAAILSLSRARFEELLLNLRFARTLLETLCGRCREAWQQVELLSYRDAEARVRMALYKLCQKHGAGTERGVRIELRLPHRELANMIGLTRETATRALARLQAEKLIEMEGRRLLVPDPERLIDEPALE